MLPPPPSKLSRVCGHGHIKKFWLLQTQIETQQCDGETNAAAPLCVSPQDMNVDGLDASCSSLSASEEGSYAGDASGCGRRRQGVGTGKERDSSQFLSSCDSEAVEEDEGYFGGVAQNSNAGNSLPERLFDQAVCYDARRHSLLAGPCSFKSESEFKCKSSVQNIAVAEFSESKIKELLAVEDAQDSGVGFSCLHRAQNDSHMGSSQGRSDSCGSPTSIMEPVCGDDADNSSDEKVAFVSDALEDDIDEGNASHERRIVEAPIDDNFVLKACTMCGTTKTPMWRTGPQGPKSLCNACGIRFKKYRSYPGQIDISESMSRALKRKPTSEYPRPVRTHEGICHRSSSSAEKQQKRSSKWHSLVHSRERGATKKEESSEDSASWNMHTGSSPLRKIYDYPFQSRSKKLGQLDQHQTLQRVFPEDEEEAAVLLMHLSCGLVY